MRFRNQGRVFLLLLGFVMPTQAFSQLLSCATIQGTWSWYAEDLVFTLSQDGSGNITGNMTTTTCPGEQFPITGSTTPGQFTFTATGMDGACGSYVNWLTFTGWLGQPGCNYAYGNWNNSIPNSAGFGQDDAYPAVGSTAIFVKPVDVPNSETSVSPPAAAWNATQGAPWNQTLAGQLNPSEFEGRGIYEYGQGNGTDTCWFTKSKYTAFTTISTPGFAWTTTSHNTWGADWIGYLKSMVTYYRNQKKVPCGTSFTQVLVIDAAYSPSNTPAYGSYLDQYDDLFYGVPFETNTIGGSITATAATSIRDSQTSTNTTW